MPYLGDKIRSELMVFWLTLDTAPTGTPTITITRGQGSALDTPISAVNMTQGSSTLEWYYNYTTEASAQVGMYTAKFIAVISGVTRYAYDQYDVTINDADSVKTETALILADTNAILVDTGTTLDGKVDAIKAETALILTDTNSIQVDTTAILEDTGTTLDGKIDAVKAETALILTDTNAILVDTGTTLPAENAAIDAKIDIIDANLDTVKDTDLPAVKVDTAAILVDTGTTLPATLTTIEGKIDVVDANIDSIKVVADMVAAYGYGDANEPEYP